MKRLLYSLILPVMFFAMPLTASTTIHHAAASATDSAFATDMGEAESPNKVTPEDVKEVFPSCDNLRDLGHGWLGAMEADKLIGYVAQSKPASNGIIGYKGETPLLVCFDKNKKIIRVLMMDNLETPGFVQRVVAGGLLDAWNGKTAKEAMKIKPDAISGATYTSRSIIASMQAMMKQLSTVQPSIVKSHPRRFVLFMLVTALIALSLFTIYSLRGEQKNIKKAAALAKEPQGEQMP